MARCLLCTQRVRARLRNLFMGLVLAAGAPLGLMLMRALLAGQPLTLDWALAEAGRDPLLYAYLAASTSAVFMVFGLWMAEKEERFGRLAQRDPLTDLYNRRALDERLALELARMQRRPDSLTLLFIDVDDLKAINDRRGHAAGDQALRVVGRVLASECRVLDLPARLGGDEFAVLLPQSDAEEAKNLAERIRAALDEEPRAPTVSIGVATCSANAPLDQAQLFAAADEAMYRAKRTRSVVVVPRRNTEMARSRL